MKKTRTSSKATAKVAAPVVEKAPATKTPVETKTEAAVAEVVEAEVKETPAKKAPAKKASATKKTAIKENVYLQYGGKEISQDDIVKQIKEVWTKELKKKVGEIKSINIYLKPEEDAAYYVVNDDVTGSIAF